MEVSAIEGDLLAERVAETEATAKRRRERRDNIVRSRRLKVSAEGGVMYMEEGREQSKTRAQLDAENAARIVVNHEKAKAREEREIEEEISKGIRDAIVSFKPKRR